MNISGVINIYKEAGYTSHDVVAIVRRLFSNIKVGHTGTLDPDALGVLPICLGKATKISKYLMADVKGYRAVLKLGLTTDTQDITGKVLTSNNKLLDRSEIERAILSFIGEYKQIPPMYSAIKVNGKKLYEIAREGKEIERSSRDVNIYDIKILDFLDDYNVLIDILCSKGTYIRTLCHDIGQKLFVGAVMESLLRTRSGSFFLEDSIKISELKDIILSGNILDHIIPIDKAIGYYPKAYVDKSVNLYLYNGNKIKINYINCEDKLEVGNEVLLYDYKNLLIGLYKVTTDYMLKPVDMFIDIEQIKS